MRRFDYQLSAIVPSMATQVIVGTGGVFGPKS